MLSVDELFAAQFEPDGDGFLYRKSMKGAAKRVTAAERDAFVVAYANSLRRGKRNFFIFLGVTMLALIVYLFLRPGGADNTFPQWPMLGLIAIGTIIFMAGTLHAYSAPARALAGRAEVGGKTWSRSEARRAMLAQMGYGHIATMGILGVLAFFRINQTRPLLQGENLFNIGVAVLIVVATATLLFRKWRFDRAARD